MSSHNKPMRLVQEDPWLEPYDDAIRARRQRYEDTLAAIGPLARHARVHERLGFHHDSAAAGGDWVYREWAPRAHSLSLIGDFNGWDRHAHPMVRDGDTGIWECRILELPHESLVKVHVVGENGEHDRLPATIRRCVQSDETKNFNGQIWEPPESFAWTDQDWSPAQIGEPLIYEAHIGMAQDVEDVGRYRDFTQKVLPRIVDGGYNCIQLMAIAEHPYYGSFGYHVSNFFAPSSRFGTPEELKALIDAAHSHGVAVLMDVVHAHAVKNLAEGLAEFDGQPGLYFHAGERGWHRGWDSRVFDYGRPEVRDFLLSNLAYWIEEFHFDGFRFDGVTSMLYHHHGEGVAFDHYDRYFYDGVETDALLYLQLANALVHELRPGAITIAEDMSGMPGLCRPIEDGGLGFDYRLGMGLPDFWIRTLKHRRDEDWDIHEIWNTLANRRHGEKTLAYAESHDQALVGDKTLAFWLMDSAMYWHMNTDSQDPVIDRGMALHKIIRLLTLVLGGEGWLNFIGNEFGHPEWVDFPREGNDWSFKYARRQWSLVDNAELRYQHLGAFDRAMLQLATDTHLLAAPPAVPVNMDTHNHVVVAERADLLFAFNLHPDRSIPDYQFAAPEGDWRVVLDSDADSFGGFGRVEAAHVYPSSDGLVSVYLPNRTALVLQRDS